MTVVVLINLLIAMMSDTYQRIQQQSDIEWKFGLAKLIRNMQRTQVAPSPLNLVSTWIVLTHTWYVDRVVIIHGLSNELFSAFLEEVIFGADGN